MSDVVQGTLRVCVCVKCHTDAHKPPQISVCVVSVLIYVGGNHLLLHHFNL